jgi:hypothetical protein
MYEEEHIRGCAYIETDVKKMSLRFQPRVSCPDI